MKKLFAILLLIATSTYSYAELSIDTNLSFGEIVIRDNSSISTTSITRNGQQTSTNQIIIIKQGSPGVFTLSGFAPFTTLNVSVDLPATSAMTFPQTAQFQITAVDIPTTINVGPSGSTQFKMGATISTSGNPINTYYNAEYSILLNINLDY